MTSPLDNLYSYDEMTVPPTKHTNVPPTADPTVDQKIGGQNVTDSEPSSNGENLNKRGSHPVRDPVDSHPVDSHPVDSHPVDSHPVRDPVDSHPVKRLLKFFDGEMSPAVLRNLMGISDRTYFRNHYLDVAINNGYIEATQPNSPNSPTQKYRLTAKGQAFLKEQSHE